MASEELKWTFRSLRDQCVWVRTCFDTFQGLFASGKSRHKIMGSTAPQFFGELNRILMENYLLQVCKLTDPKSTRVGKEVRSNLTVEHVNELLAAEALMTPAIENASAGLMRYRDLIKEARNQQIGHNDKEIAMTYVQLGVHTKAEALKFLVDLQTYADAVGEAVGEGALDFSTTSGPGDVADLFKALNGGDYPRDDTV